MKDRQHQQQQPSMLVNEDIVFPRMQLISSSGENLGIVTRAQALSLAHAAGLDLVILAEQGSMGVPVAKILNVGKVLYEKKKKLAEAKKHQKVIQIKELKIRPKIGEHDYETKIKQAAQFLKEGKKVKVTLVFKGREITMQDERGQAMFERISNSLLAQGIHILEEKDVKALQGWSKIFATASPTKK